MNAEKAALEEKLAVRAGNAHDRCFPDKLSDIHVAFFFRLGGEIQAATSQLQAVEQEAQSLTARNRTLEQQVAAAAEQAKLDKEIFEREKKAVQNSYDAVIVAKDQQIAVWQQRALEGQQMTAAEIAAAKVHP